MIAPHELRWLRQEAAGSSQRLAGLARRRQAGEPLQYVLGRWPFRGVELSVDRRVLIPRPETEQVVEVALAALGQRRPRVIVDLGTGSGAIALAVATERPGAEVWATDASPDALAVAGANLAGSGVHVARGSWWSALPARLRGGVDLAIANPPYVSVGEMGSLDPVVASWEPRTALEAGPVGLEAVAAVIEGAPGWLAPAGILVVEIAPHQADRARELARAAGLQGVEVRPDLAGRDRALVGRGGVSPGAT